MGSELSQTVKILETKSLWEGSGAGLTQRVWNTMCILQSRGDGGSLQQRAEYALGKLGRETSQGFVPILQALE